MKGKLQLVVALLLALALSGGLYAVAYITAGGTIGITEPTEDIATYNATATQPDFASILTADEITEILRPDADGDETNIDNPGGAHWDDVDEEIADGDSTVVYTSSAGWQEDLYSTANHTEGSGSINYVKVYIVCRSTATPVQTNAYVHIKTNGVEDNGTPETTTTSYSTFSYQWDNNPQTTDPWTWDEIDALQIGVGLRQPTTGQFTGCTQVYAEIGYGAPLVIGEVPTGDLFDITPNPRYSGDLRVGVYLANTGNLTNAYQYLNMKLYLEGSAEAEETPDYRLLSLQNGQTELTFEELAAISGDWTQTSQADFEGGTLNQVDTTTSPDDVLLDAFADNVTDSYDDETKIATSANVTVSGGQVKLTAGGASGSETFRPNAAGDDTNIAAQYPVSGAHWDKVDEVTADDYTTYISTNSTSYQRDLYNIPDHSTGSGAIDSVTAYFRFARTSAVGDVGIWQDTNNTHTIGNQGVWTNVPFNSQVKTSASFDHTSDTATDLKADGRYLIMYEIRSTSTSSTRHSILARVTLEGSAVEGSEGYGYSRNNANDEAYVGGACMVNASLNDTVVVQWRPYGVSASDVLSNSKTSLMIVRLPDSADVAYLKYTDDSNTGAYGGTTWAGNEVVWEDQVYETDTSIIQKSAANDYTFTLKKVARYLVKYDITFTSTSATRTQRIARATLAGSPIAQSYAYCYMRNATTTPNTLHALFIVDNTLTNQDLIIQAQRGAADQDGSVSRTVSASSIEIMELPSGAETVISHDDVGGQDVGSTQTLNWAKIEDQRDAAAFTIPANTTIEVEQADDYLFLGNGLIEDTDKTSSTRLTFAGDWFIGGVEDNTGGHGNYKRGDQGGADTWQASLNAHTILPLSADEQITFRTALEGDGGGANDNTVANQCGFSALRIGSLVTAYARAAVKTDGTVHTGSEESVSSDTFVTKSYQWTTNPETDNPWTWSEVDALQVGVELRAGGTASNAVCTQVYIVVAHTAYDTLGTLTSINLLYGETVGRIDSFYYDASAIPSGTRLRVQFSRDNTNWYNSAGTLGGWDTLSAGTNSIDLSGLGWSSANFYYHMEFTSDGSDTPVLDEINAVFATYYSSGDLVSSAYDTGYDLNWDWLTIYFTIAEPATTNIQFQLRSAATEGGLSSATWYGPTGTGDYYTTSGTAINSVHNGDRWIQYKAYFSGPGDSTPTLSDITITYTAVAKTYTLSVIGGSYALISADTSDWSEGWTVTPELYLEITQR